MIARLLCLLRGHRLRLAIAPRTRPSHQQLTLACARCGRARVLG